MGGLETVALRGDAKYGFGFSSQQAQATRFDLTSSGAFTAFAGTPKLILLTITA